MKKNYFAPETESLHVMSQGIICGSPVTPPASAPASDGKLLGTMKHGDKTW